MFQYNLMNVPNQDFTITANENEFLIRIRTFRGIAYADVSVNGVLTNTAMRCVANTPIFTDEVNRAAGGVFMFKCLGDDYPDYKDFNTDNCLFVLVPFGE